MTHSNILAALYFICGYIASASLYVESEHFYEKMFGLTLMFYLTWHLLDSYQDLKEN